MSGNFGESVTNPKRTLERREAEAGTSASPPVQGKAESSSTSMNQAEFSGYNKAPKRGSTEGPGQALKKRGY